MQNFGIMCRVFLLAFAALSCKLDSKNLRTGSAGAVLDTSFVYIERTPNRTEAIVRFRTKVPASCHIRYWSDNPQGGGREKAVDQKCNNTAPRKEFSEVIKPLSPTDLYTVEIAVWGRSGAFDQAEKFTVSEGENALDKNDLFVARVNLQLRTAELHRHRLGEPANGTTLDKVLRKDFGCGKNFDAPIAFNNAHRVFKIESLNFRGFTSGEATSHKSNSSFRRVRFNTIARSSEWNWNFTVHGRSYNFNLTPATVLSSVVLSTDPSNTQEVKDAQLTINPREILRYNSNSDLKLNWTVENPSDKSYIIAQISNPGSNGAISCLYDTKTGSASIPREEIVKLGKKNHDLFVGVISYQLDLTNQDQAKPAWLVETTDWKLATLAVQ